MSSRFPPLKALRAFEAAGRHGSFKAAAEELGVTPSAISRQIKTLEDHLNVPLFERNHHEVTLTVESRAYLGLITEIFQDLETGTDCLSGQAPNQPLHVVCTLTFSTCWLVPRLHEFLRRHPDQQIRLTLTVLRNFPGSNNDVDVTIQIGEAITPGFISHRLMPTVMAPVCSPQLIPPGTPLSIEAMVSKYTLLHSNATHSTWDRWLRAVGGPTPPTTHCLELATNVLAYQSARQGLGVALADISLLSDDLAAGTLVCPINQPIDTGAGWYLVYPAEAAHDVRILHFCNWALETAARAHNLGNA